MKTIILLLIAACIAPIFLLSIIKTVRVALWARRRETGESGI